MKQHVFSAYISLKKRSMNRKQQQTDLNCNLFITDFLLCSEHTRYILWFAHTIYLHLHSNHIQTELSVLHLKLYMLFFSTWSSFSAHIKKDLFSFSFSSQLISKKSQSATSAWTWWDSRDLTMMMKQIQQQQ